MATWTVQVTDDKGVVQGTYTVAFGASDTPGIDAALSGALATYRLTA